MRISSFNIARACAFACLLAACSTKNGGQNSDSNAVSGGGGAPPAGTMTTGTGGTPAGAGGSGTANSSMPMGSAGMAGSAGGGAGSGGRTGGQAGGGAAGHDQGGSGSAGMTSDGGTATDSGDMPAPMHEDLGMGDGKDVVTIGDSWMQLYIAGIEQSLDKASGQMYRHYAVPGTLVLDEVIPNQYESAKMENPDIKTVVMTGGGNDILTTSCADTACNPIVDMVSARLTKLMQEMGKDGVQDVVLIGYTYPDDTTKRESLDYSIMLSKTSCTTDTMPRCHSLDSTMLSITLRDGIHPDDAGYDLVGQTVWQMMQDEGMRR